MSTQNNKAVRFKVLSIFSVLTSAACITFVFERLIAAVFKLYKFDFAWPSPIYLNRPTVALFLLVMVLLTAITYFLTKLSSGFESKITYRFRISMMLNISAVGILAIMLVARLAVLNM